MSRSSVPRRLGRIRPAAGAVVPRLRRAVTRAVAVAAVVMLCTAAAPDLREPAPPPPVPTAAPLPVSHWQGLFDAESAGERQASLRLSRSADSWDHYNLAYQIDANVSLFLATGQARYADLGLTMAENMIGSARPSSSLPASGFKDGYRGWAATQLNSGGQELALTESYAWRYVTHLLVALRSSPLYGDPSYLTRYQRVLEFSEKHIFEKWFTRDPVKFIYRERTHMAAHWAYISIALAKVTSDNGLRKRYREVAAKIDDDLPNYPSSLRGQLMASRSEPMAYWWSDVWGRKTGNGQDIAHGNGVISYVAASCDWGAGWTSEEMSRFSRTLTAFVLGRDGRYPEFVNGRGSGTGWLADGFVKLGRYNPAVQRALEQHGVQNSQFHASMALNAHLLATARP